MAEVNLETATLFTPGRASYVSLRPEGGVELHLTEASTNRAALASDLFDPNFHPTAVFAGGYPGVAQSWPPEHTPPLGGREADLMARPLIKRLQSEHWDEDTIARRILRQSESDNSIGDVLWSVRKGLLNPDDFHSDNGATSHGIQLVAGVLHGKRFKDILTKALDIEPSRIRRAPLRDVYGTPATEFRPAEYAPLALAKEAAAIVITRKVLKDVRPGSLEDLSEAEQRFNEIALSGAKEVVKSLLPARLLR